MKIETKFDIGDRVRYTWGNGAWFEGEIKEIVFWYDNPVIPRYRMYPVLAESNPGYYSSDAYYSEGKHNKIEKIGESWQNQILSDIERTNQKYSISVDTAKKEEICVSGVSVQNECNCASMDWTGIDMSLKCHPDCASNTSQNYPIGEGKIQSVSNLCINEKPVKKTKYVPITIKVDTSQIDKAFAKIQSTLDIAMENAIIDYIPSSPFLSYIRNTSLPRRDFHSDGYADFGYTVPGSKECPYDLANRHNSEGGIFENGFGKTGIWETNKDNPKTFLLPGPDILTSYRGISEKTKVKLQESFSDESLFNLSSQEIINKTNLTRIEESFASKFEILGDAFVGSGTENIIKGDLCPCSKLEWDSTMYHLSHHPDCETNG